MFNKVKRKVRYVVKINSHKLDLLCDTTLWLMKELHCKCVAGFQTYNDAVIRALQILQQHFFFLPFCVVEGLLFSVCLTDNNCECVLVVFVFLFFPSFIVGTSSDSLMLLMKNIIKKILCNVNY